MPRPHRTIDAGTRRWIRNESDSRAAAAGCRFDEQRGQFVVDWIHRYCRLYEGEYAGQVLELRDWQLDCTLRMFGWVRFSQRWQREVRRFNQASIWIAKKNKKSPTLAAWGLYLLCGDGEQGQKVFFGAKDGKQARAIAGEHALAMLDASEELSDECKVNRGTYRIQHVPTRSFMEPLSSSNVRTQQSKEGINGSVLIDETHVVDRAFINRISRAGISRSEPFQIEVSTAGNNPDGYGKERFDYAAEVLAGKRTDPALFVAIYAAPQTVTDVELDAAPLKYAKMANPALGHTVDPDELLADYQRSKRSKPALAECKMYRFNVWQHAANPWLKASDWEKCKRRYREEDLLGRPCCAALDLARRRDCCAWVLTFPEDDGTFKQIFRFWVPRKRAEDLRSQCGYLEWAAAGDLVLTEGDTTDYPFIRHCLIDDAKKFQIVKVAYDETYAEQLLQRLVEEDGAFGTDQLFPFKQRITEFANPCDQFEALIIDEKLHHNGNRLAAWQAAHVAVYTDANNNKRPIKPGDGEHKTIDGIVAAVMSLDMVQQFCGAGQPQIVWI